MNCNLLKYLLILCLGGLFMVGCVPGEFFVEATIPTPNAKNVSRTTAITITLRSINDIDDKDIDPANFSLVDLGTPRARQARQQEKPEESKPAQQPNPAKPEPQEAEAAPATTAASDAVPIILYLDPDSRREVNDAGRSFIEVDVVLSPLEPLKKNHVYEVTLNKRQTDGADVALIFDHRSEFTTSRKPKIDGPRLVGSLPASLTGALGCSLVGEEKEQATAEEDQIHPNQSFCLEYDQPVAFEDVKQAFRIRQKQPEGAAKAYLDLDFVLFHIDSLDPTMRLRRFVARAKSQLRHQLLISVGTMRNLEVSEHEASYSVSDSAQRQAVPFAEDDLVVDPDNKKYPLLDAEDL